MAAAKKKAVKKTKRVTKDDVIKAIKAIRVFENDIEKLDEKIDAQMDIVNTFLSYGKK